MARVDYIRNDSANSQLLRKLLIGLLILALLAGVVIGVYILTGNRQADDVLADFELALTENRYEDAISLYRLTQEKSLTSGVLDQQQKTFQAVLAAMEKAAGERLQLIETQLLANGQLKATDIVFAEKMAEVSAVRLISFMRQLCIDYMDGKLDRAILVNAFGQLASLKNLNDAIGQLPSEFDQMTQVQPQMIKAMADLQALEYWQSWQGFADIIADENLKGFVQDQARLRQIECEQAMHKPLLDDAELLMAGGRYLSAQSALTRLAAVFVDDTVIKADLAECAARVPAKLENYSSTIEVISIKPLIVSPARAFDGDAYSAAANDAMLTTGEFSKMLAELYANNFILIDSSRIYTAERQRAVLKIPPGKKPLILVIEGLNYYATRRQTGNCWDLLLDENGNVSAEFMNDSGQMTVDRQGEAIGILDQFVLDHPDFSLDGAKGTISLTGYECIFGTVTDQDQLEDRNQALLDNGMAGIALTPAEIEANYQKVQSIMNRLKNTGWEFASSTYGFIDLRAQPIDRIQADTAKWLAQVGSLTGPVSFINYPNGAFLTGSDERAAWLRSQGFILFGGQGTTAYLIPGEGYIYIDKTPINGYTLTNSQTYHLDRFFDVSKIYDATVRP